MTINQRIRKHLDEENFNVKKIPEIIDMSWKMVKSYVEGDAVPSLKLISWLFQQFPNLNPQWLFFGKGSRVITKGNIDIRDTEIQNGRIAELEKKYDSLKKAYLEQGEALEAIYKEFKAMDIAGTVSQLLKKKNQ